MNRARRNAYHFLMKSFPIWGKTKLWRNLWERTIQPPFDLSIQLHGAPALIPSTYRYPLTARQIATFNNPYVELVFQTWRTKKRKLVVVDIGAAIGDGLLLVQQNTGEAIEKFYCIDGHADFLKYLKANAQQFDNTQVIDCILSDKEEDVPSLIEIHTTTASAQGKQTVRATTLDIIWTNNALPATDVIKIDVDGFDLKVITGAKKLLASHKPHVLFEYHPWHLLDTGSDHLSAFSVLKECGYEKLLWFDKFGIYKHEMTTDDPAAILSMRQSAMNAGREPDVHYDVIAIPANSQLNIVELKKCNFANNKPFPF